MQIMVKLFKVKELHRHYQGTIIYRNRANPVSACGLALLHISWGDFASLNSPTSVPASDCCLFILS